MYMVIICTVSSGRVQQKSFNTWEAARQCADHWMEKGRSYRVTLERTETHVAPTQQVRPGCSAAA
jgi:hypothetical protein